MSYTTVTSRTSRMPLSGIGSDTLSPAWLALGALVIGGVIYSYSDKPMKRNGRRSVRVSRLRRNSRARRTSRRR